MRLVATEYVSLDGEFGTAVWTRDGLICSAGAFKDHVKLNSVDIAETGLADEPALRDLVRAAVAYNVSSPTRS